MPDLFDASNPNTPPKNNEIDIEVNADSASASSGENSSANSSSHFPKEPENNPSDPIQPGGSFLRPGRGARLARRPRSMEDDSTRQASEEAQATSEPAGEPGQKVTQEYKREAQRPPHRHVDEYSEVMRHENPTKNHFSSFLAKPEGLSFDTQAPSEHIILVLRRHPITQLGVLMIALGLIFAPLLFSSIGLVDFLPPNYRLAIVLGWYLMVVGFVFEAFLRWFFHVYIITDERIIDVDFLSLIYKNISAAKIDNIEDVSAVTGGFTASIFNLGTVFIQTAAEQREFDFEDVPQPSKVTSLINELILEEEREKIEGRIN